MTEIQGSGGGAIGKLWRQHGGGYYALIAVGTFAYLEIHSFFDAFLSSNDVGDFVRAELIETIFTFGLQTMLNSLFAGLWPWMWITWMGLTEAALYAGAGYVIWALLLAMALNRREQSLRKELGVD